MATNARGRETARNIEREAVRLAAERGPDVITVDEICAAVGVSQRTFFNHFSTKDDALLGIDLPHVDENRAREYLADPSVGLLRGALGLVSLPNEVAEDPQLAVARFRVLTASPALAQRQAMRFMAVIGEVEDVVLVKLRGRFGDARDERELRTAARAITALAGALIMRFPAPDAAKIPQTDPLGSLDELLWVWPDLL